MEPISPELALVDPDLARRARALLPAPAGADSLREDAGPASPSARTRFRVRRDALVRAAAWLAVPSIALNIAFLRTDSAAEPQPLVAPARVLTVTAPASAARTDRDVHRPSTRPSHAGVASAWHERTVRRRPAVALRVLRWPASTKAAAYDVVVWRGHRRIADVWTTKPKVSVAAVACHGTTPLAAGKYLWFVYPLVHASPRRYGPLVKWGTLVVPARVRCSQRGGTTP